MGAFKYAFMACLVINPCNKGLFAQSVSLANDNNPENKSNGLKSEISLPNIIREKYIVHFLLKISEFSLLLVCLVSHVVQASKHLLFSFHAIWINVGNCGS